MQQDYAIVFVATMSHEGGDRASLSLDDGCVVGAKNGGTQCTGNNNNQNAMVEAIVAANPKTIVVASVPGAILVGDNSAFTVYHAANRRVLERA